MTSLEPDTPSWTLRHALRPGDIGEIVRLHGVVYAREHGFDSTFEAYVAGPLAEFVRAGRPRDRLWVAEREDRIVGCVALVEASETEAQLRWFLVDPPARGLGLGRGLLGEAVGFARSQRYESVFLWTVSALKAAAHLYQAVGFVKVEDVPGRRWGVEVCEESHRLTLGSPPEVE